jgi:hypothetical protein
LFKIVANPTAWAKVEFPGLTDDGEAVTNLVELHFILHDEDANIAILADAAQLPGKLRDMVAGAIATATGTPAAEAEVPTAPIADRPASELFADFIMRVADNWRGVAGENGEPLKWSAEHVRALCGVPNFFRCALAAYLKARAGEKEVREGN